MMALGFAGLGLAGYRRACLHPQTSQAKPGGFAIGKDGS
jgi:hypothetical protein